MDFPDRRVPWFEAVSLLVPLVAVLVPLARMLGTGATTMEEGTVLVVASGILDGRLPHADVSYLYAPGSVWTVAGAFSVFGTSVVVERLVGLGYRLLLLWGIHRLARRWGLSTAACTTLATWAVLAPFGLIAYPWVAGLGLLAAGTALVLDGEDRRTAAVGASLCGLAAFHQVVLAPAVLLVVVPAFLSATDERRARLGTGLVAGLFPFLLHMVLVGPRVMFEGMVLDPVVRLRAGRRLPLPPDPNDSGDFFARLDDLVRGPSRFPGLDRPAQITALFWLLLASTVVLLVMAWRWRGSARSRLTTMAVVGAALVPMVLQRPSPNHLKFVGAWTVAVGVVAIAEPLGALLGRLPGRFSGMRLGRSARHLAPPIALAAILGGLALLAPHHIGRFTIDAFTDRPLDGSTATVVHDGRTLPVGRGSGAEAVADEIDRLVGLVDALTRPGDRLFVGPADLTRTNYSDTSLYFLLPDLVPASRHIEMNPGLANRQGSGLAADLAAADVLVLTDRFDGWSEPNASVFPGDPAPAAVVADRFCDVGGTATWRVLTPCGLPGVDPADR
ncbi:MAG: hypothetical protein QF777_11310 [Acidimicrobiales bacterium]|jgi:hypothetical protein|nr:hypothetical protein [Actinomycetes bacterium]MDP6286616.1 hypothetical protein [Acidimicrobiales bacterium]MDP6912132.1 hypothetical protein [Acidimicrobiales bacterium]HCW01402.1 hypothetical protein [Acidimicrobiaceae bacterium]HJM71922.1 hypothetical protein [Acidimicrobiales bacterium]|tara:strand:- start:1996 stop:3672 length:1677 start_codon:yes stop_codon:yes gene_type:complete